MNFSLKDTKWPQKSFPSWLKFPSAEKKSFGELLTEAPHLFLKLVPALDSTYFI